MKYSHLIVEWKRSYEEGSSYRDISREYNVNPGTVRRTLQGHVTTRKHEDYSKYAKEWKRLVVDEGWSRNDISKRYNVNHTSVTRVLKKEGLSLSERKFEHLVKEMTTLYEAGDSLTEISDKLGISRQTVLNYLDTEGVHIRDSSERNRIYKINEHYFDTIDSKEKAHYLGLIFSIGTFPGVFQTFSLQLAEKEENQFLIENVLNILYPNDKPNISVDSDNISKVRINSRHLQETLMAYGLSKKHDTTFPSMIDEKWFPYFIAGYFQGRGSIQPDRLNLYLGGSNEMILFIVEFFSTIIPKEKITVRNVSEKGKSINIYHNEYVQKILDLIDIY